MAVKKAIEEQEAVVTGMATESPKKAGAGDPWKKIEKIRIPKKEDGSPNYVIASVNSRVYKIKRGETVDVPAPIAEVIQHSYDAQDAAELFMESKAD